MGGSSARKYVSVSLRLDFLRARSSLVHGLPDIDAYPASPMSRIAGSIALYERKSTCSSLQKGKRNRRAFCQVPVQGINEDLEEKRLGELQILGQSGKTPAA